MPNSVRGLSLSFLLRLFLSIYISVCCTCINHVFTFIRSEERKQKILRIPDPPVEPISYEGANYSFQVGLKLVELKKYA